MKKQSRLSRRDKGRAANEPDFDPRFRNDIPKRDVTLTKLEAKNQNQKIALSYLNTGTPVVFLTGSAGTGKSMLAAYRAATMLREKKIEKIILMRPAVAMGKSVGLLPGEIEEKMAPYFRQMLIHLRKFLGPGNYFENKKIEMFPAEYARSNSFEDCIVIVEEAQNFDAGEFETMLTRLGKNCQMIFTGDTKQHDLKGTSGLKTTVALLKKIQTSRPDYMADEDMDELDEGIGIVQFTPEDVVRSGLTKAFVKMYYNN